MDRGNCNGNCKKLGGANGFISHLSDDKAVAKMGHPFVLGSLGESVQLQPLRIRLQGFSGGG